MKLILIFLSIFFLNSTPTVPTVNEYSKTFNSVSIEYSTNKNIATKHIVKSAQKKLSSKKRKRKVDGKSIGRGILFIGLFLIFLLATALLVGLAISAGNVISLVLFLVLALQTLIGSFLFLNVAAKSFPDKQNQRMQKFEKQKEKLKQLQAEENVNTWKQEVHNLSEKEVYKYILLNKDLDVLKNKEKEILITIRFRKERFLHIEEATTRLNEVHKEIDSTKSKIDALKSKSKSLE